MTEQVCSREEIAAELKEKRGRVQEFLRERDLEAVLLQKHENIAWMTAGLAEVRVGMLRETGPTSLLVTRDDRAFYLTTNNEAQRMRDEEFGELGEYEAVVQPWYAADVAGAVRKIAGAGRVGADAGVADFANVGLQALRWKLTEGEAKRYRWLGRQVAEVAEAMLRTVRPGMSEREMQGRLADELLRRGILPSVFLEAVDGRARSYRHAVPRDGVVERFAMLGFCARRWGLAVSMTRFVHFGAMPAELEEKFAVVAEVNAKLQNATQAGATAEQLFGVARDGYAAAGHAGEETMHHQGGAAGYLEREWVARPGGAERVEATQAFAWNPNLQGAKVEDTVLLQDGQRDVLTATPGLPQVKTKFAGQEYVSAGVLMG